VPLPRLEELTVTVEADPAHTGEPALVLKLLTLGLALTVWLTALLVLLA
jgi:hypothetical protein